ncbi:MAG: MarR family transcriptional regulator [Rhodobacteraceae bacterium]|nr:MarR family transcriptional regulator [Paracoccaceae bacterium]
MTTGPLPTLFAELGSHFGLSRPAGLCLGAIWRAAQAPCADDLTAALGLSRSNVSTALKELREWGLVSVARAPADRKEYFTAPADPWDMIRTAISARHRRVMAPALDRLLLAEAESPDARIAALHSALSDIADWAGGFATLSTPEVAQAFRPATTDTAKAPGKKKKKKKKA